MARISVSKAWDDSLAFIARDRALITPVVLALVFFPTLLFRVFVKQPTLADMMAGNYPAWLPVLSYGLVFIQLVAGVAVMLLALGSRETVGATIVTGFRRALVIVLALLLGALIATPVVMVMLVVVGIAGGMPSDPQAIPPGFAMAVLLIFVFLLMFVLRLILALPAASIEPIGPWRALKRGWQLGRGSGFALIATMMLLLIGAMVLSYAASAVIGTAAHLMLGSDSGPNVGGVLVALIVALVGAGVFIVQYVLLANLYRQAVGEERPVR